MHVPSQIFREYDIRGVADRDLTDELVHALGLALATMLPAGPKRRLALARDCRVSSERLHAAFDAGLVEGGVHVVDVGVGPTPMLYFAVAPPRRDGGIMITGSHNPGDENGFKMMRGKASFFGADIQALRAMIEASDFAAHAGAGTSSRSTCTDAYVDAVTSDIERPARRSAVRRSTPATAPAARSACARMQQARRSTPTRSSARWTGASRTTTPIRPCRRTSPRSSRA